jgi:diguanylate cyclase (GGDEF)-like protein
MPPSPLAAIDSPPLKPGWWGWLGFFVAFVVASEVGRLIAFDGSLAAISFPAGLYAAAILMVPRRVWPTLFVVTLAGNLTSNVLWHGVPLLSSTLNWLANTMGMVVGAMLFLCVYPRGSRVTDRRSLVMFVACMAILGTLVSALLRAATQLVVDGHVVVDTSTIHWQGRMLGVALIAPFLLNATDLQPWREPDFERRAICLGGLVLGTVVIGTCVFAYQQRPIVFAAIPFLACAAIRHRVCGASLTTLALGVVVIWNTALGRGPFALDDSVSERVLLAQAYLAVLGMVSMTLAALTIEVETWTEDANNTRQALEKANHFLQHRATTDALTQLHNRGAFDQKLEEEVSRAMRHDLPLSLVLLDIDHFKAWNDEFGHPAGDEVLRRVAGVLATTARVSDVVARVGGEEFAILLTHTDRAGAAVVAERFRAAVADETWEPRPVTISVGFASFSPLDRTGDALVARADHALYLSKQAGRNRVSAAA